MTRGADQEPWANIRSASNTSSSKSAKIKRPRRATGKQRRQAPPAGLAARYGARTPVTMTVTIRTGADVWAEVLTEHGRFFVAFDASVFDLVQQIIRGGHIVEELSASLLVTHRRGISNLKRENGSHSSDKP